MMHHYLLYGINIHTDQILLSIDYFISISMHFNKYEKRIHPKEQILISVLSFLYSLYLP